MKLNSGFVTIRLFQDQSNMCKQG